MAQLIQDDREGGTFDFHALRHTFLTNLARFGVHPKLAQQLARHSTIVLTMDRYSHVAMDEQAEALALLPELSQAMPEVARATGTAGNSVLADCLALKGAAQGSYGAAACTDDAINSAIENSENTRENSDNCRVLRDESEVRLVGLEPTTYGLKVRCSAN